MADFAERLVGCVIFSKVDLRKGNHQSRIHAADIPKTAIIKPFGLWEFLPMMFGLRNAGNTFRQYMDRVLSGLDLIFVYLDDVIIDSCPEEEHIQHLRILFQLSDASLVTNREKCAYGMASVEFLGHHVTVAGTSSTAAHLEAIQCHPRPDGGGAPGLFGYSTVNFSPRFVPVAARILRPLTDMLRSSPGHAVILDWSGKMSAAFQVAKAALCKTVRLAHPSATAELALMLNASAEHVALLFSSERQ
jgi:hypothetical protein